MSSKEVTRVFGWGLVVFVIWLLLRIWRRVMKRRSESAVPLHPRVTVTGKGNEKSTDRPNKDVRREVAHTIPADNKEKQQKQKSPVKSMRRRDLNKNGETVEKENEENEVNERMELASAAPFLGFSLVDNVTDGVLVVDGIFRDGPADNVGIHIDDELIKINGVDVNGMEHVRELVRMYCVPGKSTPFVFRHSDGVPFEVELGVMTAERRFSKTKCYYDPTQHDVMESDREKNECRS
ncbi:PDZ domain [Trypanosoma melophagium]|uniref:PDZ domain n=1 Tax=Trypanosoma melophagium TaxID=715481 RepID=UPI00351A4536|nr:PDZ domain [Trypanosoma melophagium]